MTNAPALSPDRSFVLPALVRGADACGVAIDVEVSTEAPVYSVYLLVREGAHARRIALTTDEQAARRLWGLLARSLRVPRFIAQVSGDFRALDVMYGSVVAKAPAARRGRRMAIRRRPSSRRAKAQAGARAIHTGEREIICYE